MGNNALQAKIIKKSCWKMKQKKLETDITERIIKHRSFNTKPVISDGDACNIKVNFEEIYQS